MIAANVELPWPVALLVTLIGLITTLSAALALVRASSVKANLELLRGERDDYKAAYEHADSERDRLQKAHDEEVHQCAERISRLEKDLEVLKSVVSGATAVRELGDLLLTVEGQHRMEILGAIRAMGSDIKTQVDSLLTLMGQGGRQGGSRRSDPQGDI